MNALEGGQGSRPLRVVVSDCQFLVDLGTRNAVWGAVSHLISAFSSRPKLDPTHRTLTAPTPSTARSPSPFASLLSPAGSLSRKDVTAELQRRVSNHHTSRSPSQVSETVPESNELLSLLLEQRETAGGHVGSNLNTPQATASEELELPGEGMEEDADGPMTTPLDDVHSTLRYEVEVINLQVMIQQGGEAGAAGLGRLLLAAKGGRLRGLSLNDGPAPLQITTLAMEAVQAYVSIADVDPHVSLTWLKVEKDGFSVIEDGGPATLRRVFNPIRIDLRHSKVPSSALTTRRPPPSRALSSLRTPTPGGQPGAQVIKSEELVLKVRC